LQAEVMQQIMTAVLATDADKDFIVDPPEVEVLILRLKNLPGIDFDEAGFRALLQQTEPPGQLTMADMCTIARMLQDQTQTMEQSKAQRESVFAASPKSMMNNSDNLFSPRRSDGNNNSSPQHAKPTSPQGGGVGGVDRSIFQFKPRSFLKKKVLGLF